MFCARTGIDTVDTRRAAAFLTAADESTLSRVGAILYTTIYVNFKILHEHSFYPLQPERDRRMRSTSDFPIPSARTSHLQATFWLILKSDRWPVDHAVLCKHNFAILFIFFLNLRFSVINNEPRRFAALQSVTFSHLRSSSGNCRQPAICLVKISELYFWK